VPFLVTYTSLFYILIDLQGSQTRSLVLFGFKVFYILIDLQGSQTKEHNLDPDI